MGKKVEKIFIKKLLISNIKKIKIKNFIILNNYSPGNKKNYIKNSKTKYLKIETIDFSKHLKK